MVNFSAASLRLLSPYPSQRDLPLLVFVPGMDGTGHLYGKQIQQLKHHFDIRCLSIPLEDRQDWSSLGQQLAILLERESQQAAQPLYLCGESFGGCLSLQVALHYPRLLERLILVNPASCFHRRPWLSWGIPVTQWVPEFIHRTSALMLLPFMASLNRIQASDRQDLLKAMQSVPPSTVSWRLSLLQKFCLEPTRLRGITQPVLVVASQSDRLLPSLDEAHHLVRQIPNAQLQILSDSGHACLLESEINLKLILETANFLPLLQPAAVS